MTAILLILIIVLAATIAKLAALVASLTARVNSLEGNPTRRKRSAVIVPPVCTDLARKGL